MKEVLKATLIFFHLFFFLKRNCAILKIKISNKMKTYFQKFIKECKIKPLK